MPRPTCSSGSVAAGEANGRERGTEQSSGTRHSGWQAARPKTA